LQRYKKTLFDKILRNVFDMMLRVVN